MPALPTRGPLDGLRVLDVDRTLDPIVATFDGTTLLQTSPENGETDIWTAERVYC